MEPWTTKEGKKIEVRDMDDSQPHTDMDFFKGCALAGTLGCLGLLALSLAPAAIMVLGHLMD